MPMLKLWSRWHVSNGAISKYICSNHKHNTCTYVFTCLHKGMNVVMPTAMTIIHQDLELKECAAKTAENGKKILRLLKGTDLVIDNCMAIDRVCAELGGDDELYTYWDKFFRNYKYGVEEKEAIGLAVSEFC